MEWRKEQDSACETVEKRRGKVGGFYGFYIDKPRQAWYNFKLYKYVAR